MSKNSSINGNKAEAWKDVIGYEGKYQVSSIGRIKSVGRKSKCRLRHTVTVNERIMKLTTAKKRGFYKLVTLTSSSVQVRHRVHRLVAMAFIPNPDNKPEVNHIDGDPSNNKVSNLEWVTKRENLIHSFRTLNRSTSKPTGLKSTSSKYIIYKYTLDGKVIDAFFSTGLAAISVGGTRDRIWLAMMNDRVFRGFRWKYELRK